MFKLTSLAKVVLISFGLMIFGSHKALADYDGVTAGWTCLPLFVTIPIRGTLGIVNRCITRNRSVSFTTLRLIRDVVVGERGAVRQDGDPDFDESEGVIPISSDWCSIDYYVRTRSSSGVPLLAIYYTCPSIEGGTQSDFVIVNASNIDGRLVFDPYRPAILNSSYSRSI